MATVRVIGDATIPDEFDEGGASSPSRVSLLEVEPDLVRWLSVEQRAAAQRFWLPVATVNKDDDVSALLEGPGRFGLLMLDGLVLQALQVGLRATLRLLGPGAVVPIAAAASSVGVGSASLLVPGRARLVLLGDEFLLAAHRWPWLMTCLHARMVEQSQRLAAQLAISQLPRVEDRVMAMMWLLADSWGRVTPAGIRLPLSLSHETLGSLVGAQRPTVTLALIKLAERNSLIKQNGDWLILEPPSPSASAKPLTAQASLADTAASAWVSPGDPEPAIREPQFRYEQTTRVSDRRRLAKQLVDQASDLCEHSRELRDRSREQRRLLRL